MVIQITQENETRNFWTFKEIGENTESYDIPKEQLASAFLNLERWQKETIADNFSSKLFDLMAKADTENFKKLFNGFPARVTAYSLWYWSKDKSELEKYRGGDGQLNDK